MVQALKIEDLNQSSWDSSSPVQQEEQKLVVKIQTTAMSRRSLMLSWWLREKQGTLRLHGSSGILPGDRRTRRSILQLWAERSESSTGFPCARRFQPISRKKWPTPSSLQERKSQSGCKAEEALYVKTKKSATIGIPKPTGYMACFLKGDWLSMGPISVYLKHDKTPIWTKVVQLQAKIQKQTLDIKRDPNL